MGSNFAAALFLLLAAVPSILAVTFQVGDTTGWNSGVDYTTWASGKTFRVGDTLEFQYDSSHSVSVVDKAGFDSCDSTGETQSFSGGDTKIDLTTVGTMHFLCPSPGHCLGGMKLAVPVLPAASSPAPPSPRTPPFSTPSPSLSPRSPRKPKTPPPTASPPANGTPDSESLTPSPSPSTPSPSTPSLSPSTPSPSPSPPNAAYKGVMSYGVIGMTMVLMFGVMN